MTKPNPLKTILLAGLVAGVLDITAATIQYYLVTHNNPTRMYQFIASGIFGKEAFAGGTSMAVVGLLFHFLIAMTFAAFFYLIYPKVYPLFKNKVVMGLVYGIFAWCVMNLVVVPMSKITPRPFRIVPAAIAMGILMLCIGLPIALIVHRHYARRGIS
ncbi:MAG: hypothetical protein WCF67_18060 [Chitinophagaceae bacterium]